MSGWRSSGGGSIDRARPIAFHWDRRKYQGFAGDTLASALVANGVAIVGRSFKYHRPRGLIGAGLEEANAIVQLETGASTVPNVKATQIELYEGLRAAPVNAWPSPKFDLMAVNSLFKRFIPAAFYYKTFFWPSWRLFEPSIRKAAGLGVAPQEPDIDNYEHRFSHVDVLIVGSGAAGLAAAEQAAAYDANQRIMLVEADAEFGGGLLAARAAIGHTPAAQWAAAAVERLRAMSNVQLLNRTMAFGFYDHGLVGLCERLTDHVAPIERSGPRQRLWKVRCKRVIFATGAFERPIPFPGNDIPGVMLASAAMTFAQRFGAVPGRRIVICTNNDSAYASAFALQDAGCDIVAIVDSRSSPSSVEREAKARSIDVRRGMGPISAAGRRSVKRLFIADFPTRTNQQAISCDAVLTSDGWNPAVHLHSQAGGSLSYNSSLRAFIPKAQPQSAESVGAAAGIFDLKAAIEHARAVGAGRPSDVPSVECVGPTRSFSDGDPSAETAWLDFQNDVTVADVQLAARENFRSVEHLKRYTTLGMASDQGKTSNVSAIHVLSDLLGKPADAIGTTKFRPPFDPVTIGAFAGRATGHNLMPLARVSAHDQQVAARAEMEAYGGWLRAAFYRQQGEGEQGAIAREVLAVRNSAGLFEASPLGKIEVKGEDAAEFLHRIYVNSVRNLKPGHCRYGLMLTEHGIVFDDGICACIGLNHFLVGTTSGHASAVTDMLNEWLQCEWPHLRVMVENVTTAWAVMNVAGPQARQVLSAAGCDVDLSAGAFPHMTYREGKIAGVSARIQRVSFSGELSYEVAVPWGYGASLWEAILSAGRPFSITPFGIEALMVMRIEKGFFHVGTDTDGTTYPQDVGFTVAMEKKADDFVGRRSTMRPDAQRTDRRQLVGLEVTDGQGPLITGAHVLPIAAQSPQRTQGWVTSSAASPTLGRPLALAVIEGGRARMGEDVKVWHLGQVRSACIADPRFFDPQGSRLNG